MSAIWKNILKAFSQAASSKIESGRPVNMRARSLNGGIMPAITSAISKKAKTAAKKAVNQTNGRIFCQCALR